MIRLSLSIGLALAAIVVGYAGAFLTYRATKLGRLEPKLLKAPIEWAGDSEARCALLMVGDSRIAQWPLEPRPGWRIGKLGFSGETAANIEPSVRAQIAEAKPTVVVVQAGANDATAAVFQGESERRRTIERAAAAVIATAEDARRAGASQVFVLTIAPPNGLELWKRALMSSTQTDVIGAISDRIVREAGDLGLTTLDANRLLRDGEGRLRPEFRRDGMHWSEAAYRALDAALWAAVKPCQSAEPPQR